MPTNKPIRCFDGSAKPNEPFWKFINSEQSQSGQAEMELYGILSEYSWFEDEITPAKFKDDLYKFGKGGPVLMKINSPGGDVIAASVMRSIMSDYPGEITARVDGMAASAAVAVTMAAKKVVMMDSAYMMIHDPLVLVFLAALNIETLGKLRDDLKIIKDGLVATYAQKTKLDEGKISRMMADETWMSARQAVEYGFADEVLNGGQSAPVNMAYVNALRNYENIPQEIRSLVVADAPKNQVNSPDIAESSAAKWTDENEREAQDLREKIQNILKEKK